MKNGRTIRDVRIESLMASITSAAIDKAVKAAAQIDGADQSASPTSIRLKRGTLVFFDSLATHLGASRNAVISMLLEHIANTGAASLQLKRMLGIPDSPRDGAFLMWLYIASSGQGQLHLGSSFRLPDRVPTG